tara:strand:- start:349 stop:735 length:387 start_codon:yes stop_codon:yes gene_type:complete
MNELFYGDGICSVKGSNIVGVWIRYKGAINIKDLTSTNFVLNYNKSQILIYAINIGSLEDLFVYEGRFIILDHILVNKEAEKMDSKITFNSNVSQHINTKSEDMSANSEDMSSSFKISKKIDEVNIGL